MNDSYVGSSLLQTQNIPKDSLKPLYQPRVNSPMRVVMFASGGGGNFKTAIGLSKKHPGLLEVGLLVTDRFGIPALDIAREHGIPYIARDFERECGNWSLCKTNPRKKALYRQAAESFHNHILEDIQTRERQEGAHFDLAVLSYHRWIHGKLLHHFHERIINQHAGDLSVFDTSAKIRRYTGINPVLAALQAGEVRTRTSTFLVRDGHDTGEILCQGPWVNSDGRQAISKEFAAYHELRQKRISDWPSLAFALKEIALGNFALSMAVRHPDGCLVMTYKGSPLPYQGVDLDQHRDTYET